MKKLSIDQINAMFEERSEAELSAKSLNYSSSSRAMRLAKREHYSIVMKQAQSRPEVNAKRSASLKAALGAAHSARLVSRNKSPEMRAKVSAAASKPQAQTTCPHCGKTGGVKTMPRWHFDNCKFKL